MEISDTIENTFEKGDEVKTTLVTFENPCKVTGKYKYETSNILVKGLVFDVEGIYVRDANGVLACYNAWEQTQLLKRW